MDDFDEIQKYLRETFEGTEWDFAVEIEAAMLPVFKKYAKIGGCRI